MQKAEILHEIKRAAAANDGAPMGRARFQTETGIKPSDWFGIYWATWGEAVREAGFKPNDLNRAFAEEFLLEKYAVFVSELGRLPTDGDLRLKRRGDPEFPTSKSFGRFGNKKELVKKVLDFSRPLERFANVIAQCENYLRSSATEPDEQALAEQSTVGYVYLLKHGPRREYKIGQTNNPLRREGELGIQLPEKCEPIHYIQTDDPQGVEAYWHRRFASKRKEGEWFALTAQDVRSFKRWRRIY